MEMVKRPNVLLLTLDCLRADHLGCYGYRGADTANMDWLAENGVRFENAYAHGTNTWVSHASIFTGMYPSKHGCRDVWSRIDPQVATAAELFRGAGYRTLGLPSLSLLDASHGFARGFDAYVLEGLEVEHRWAKRDHQYHRPARESLEALLGWLDSGSKPFFVWLHYFGTHLIKHPELAEYSDGYSAYADNYDGKVTFADTALVGPIVECLSERTGLENTVLVITSDHGEDLQSLHQDGIGHNRAPTPDVVRVPLIVHGPRFAAQQVLPCCVRHIDLLPTILDWCGIAPVPDMHGVSLAQVLAGGTEPDGTSCVCFFENTWMAYAALKAGHRWFSLDWAAGPSQGAFGKIRRALKARAELTRRYMLEMAPAAVARRVGGWFNGGNTFGAQRSERELSEVARDLRRGRASFTVRLEERESTCPECEQLTVWTMDQARHCFAEHLGLDRVADAISDKAERQQVEARLRDLGYM